MASSTFFPSSSSFTNSSDPNGDETLARLMNDDAVESTQLKSLYHDNPVVAEPVTPDSSDSGDSAPSYAGSEPTYYGTWRPPLEEDRPRRAYYYQEGPKEYLFTICCFCCCILFLILLVILEGYIPTTDDKA